MEILPSVKTQHSRIPFLYKPYCLFDSKEKAILKGVANPISSNKCLQIKWRKLALNSSYNDIGSTTPPGLENMPLSVDLLPISSEAQFDRVVAEAQQLEESVVVIWMASWCRNCIYLKPKLKKLAADYFPRVRFYSVDVSNVPHRLVIRAGVTKMPTIQLWRDGKKQAEVIGGHKAYLVVNEVREIIENENSSI